MALQAFDHTVGLIRQELATALQGKRHAIDRLQAVIAVFLRVADGFPVAGGCPVLNTAIEWAGLEVLAEQFPAASIFALPPLTELIRTAGDAMLAGLRRSLGDKIAAQTTIPTAMLLPFKQKIAGVRFDFREALDAESDAQLLALIPDQKAMLAFDLVFAPRDHAFPDRLQPVWGDFSGLVLYGASRPSRQPASYIEATN